METQNSVPCSQQPDTDPNPDSDESSLQLATLVP